MTEKNHPRKKTGKQAESKIMNKTFFDSNLLADENINWPADGSLPGGRN